MHFIYNINKYINTQTHKHTTFPVAFGMMVISINSGFDSVYRLGLGLDLLGKEFDCLFRRSDCHWKLTFQNTNHDIKAFRLIPLQYSISKLNHVLLALNHEQHQVRRKA